MPRKDAPRGRKTKGVKGKNNNNSANPTWLQALATRSEQAAIVQTLEHLLTDAIDPSAPVIPGLPRYFTRKILLSTSGKFVDLTSVGAAAFQQNPVVALKSVITSIRPDLLTKLHGYLKYMAYIEPSVAGAGSGGGLLQRAIGWGMAWPSVSLRIAQAYMGFDSSQPTLHKLLDDIIQLRLSDGQIRTVVAKARTLLRYAPFLLGDAAAPAGDGTDFLPAVIAMLTSLNDLQVQQAIGMALVSLAIAQPASQAWFYGLDIESLMQYLCKAGFRMHDAVCSTNKVQRRALLTALKVNQKMNQNVGPTANQKGAAAFNRSNRRLTT